MRARCLGMVLVCALGITTANAAAIIGADFVTLFDGANAVFGDNFNEPNLQTPPWIILSGSPGPGNGSTMEFHAGDAILAPVDVGGQNDVTMVFNANLGTFEAGSSLSILMFGRQPGDLLSLAITPDAAVVSNENGALGGLPINPGGLADLSLAISAAGNVTAFVNGTPVFSGTDTFTAASAIGIVLTPEPATALLAIGGLLFSIRRRR